MYSEEESSVDCLAESLITQYWKDFSTGSTWNYYNWPLRNVENDAWADSQHWIFAAEECLKNKTNIIQALEILLYEKPKAYEKQAEKVVDDWYSSGGHDAYYYYELLAKLPKDNPVRRVFFSPDEYHWFALETESEAPAARRALIRSGDEEFINYLAGLLDEKLLDPNVSQEQVEDLVPVAVDMGEYFAAKTSSHAVARVRRLFEDYLALDMEKIMSFVADALPDKNSRPVWIRDDIVQWSVTLGWRDIVDRLKTEEWYWSSVFGEWWEDSNNDTLLAWSLCFDNEILRDRAKWVMRHHEHHRLDGAIAWKRLREFPIPTGLY